MKTMIILTLVLTTTISGLFAQSQVDTYISEAQQFIAQKNYIEAQLSLQDAINEINNLIAKQIAESLPDEINGLTSNDEQISAAGMGMMGGGMQISKSYENASKQENTAEVVIIANSPMLASLGMYLTNPSMMGPEYKSVRVGTHRSIMKSEMETYYGDNGNKEIRSSELQIPFSKTLITVTLKGFASEADELAFATKLDIDKLETLLGE